MAVRYTEALSCGKKRRYDSWRAAARAARRINHEHDETLSPYMCRFCHGAHLAHMPMPRIHFQSRDEA